MYFETWKYYVSEALARAYKFFFLSVHSGVLPPPPPQYQIAGYATGYSIDVGGNDRVTYLALLQEM